MIGVAIGLVLVVWAVQWVVMNAELAEHLTRRSKRSARPGRADTLRKGGGLVDAPVGPGW